MSTPCSYFSVAVAQVNPPVDCQKGGTTPIILLMDRLDPALACTCFKLRSLARRVTSIYDEVLAGAGITVTQYGVLTVLLGAKRAHESIGVTELARRLRADRTTLTRGLNLLRDGGLITLGRRSDGGDAR